MNDLVKDLLKQSTYEILGVPQVDQKKFSELIIQECIDCCGSQVDKKNIHKLFGLPIESDILYPAPEKDGSINSQYGRKYNLPKIIK